MNQSLELLEKGTIMHRIVIALVAIATVGSCAPPPDIGSVRQEIGFCPSPPVYCHPWGGAATDAWCTDQCIDSEGGGAIAYCPEFTPGEYERCRVLASLSGVLSVFVYYGCLSDIRHQCVGGERP